MSCLLYISKSPVLKVKMLLPLLVECTILAFWQPSSFLLSALPLFSVYVLSFFFWMAGLSCVLFIWVVIASVEEVDSCALREGLWFLLLRLGGGTYISY